MLTVIDRVVEGVLRLDDLELLSAAAVGWSYRPPERGENLDDYRRALATHIRVVDQTRTLIIAAVRSETKQ